MIEGVQSVSQEAFYQSAEFWVGFSFILVVGLLYSPLFKVIKELISKRITRIKTELQEAENLKLDAQKLYAEYERKFINMDNEVNEIIINQKNLIEQTKEKKLKELNNILKRRQLETQARIDQEFNQVQQEINEAISYKALSLIEESIQTKLSSAERMKLIDNSIKSINDMKFEA